MIRPAGKLNQKRAAEWKRFAGARRRFDRAWKSPRGRAET